MLKTGFKKGFRIASIAVLSILGVTIGVLVITNPFILVIPVALIAEIPRKVSTKPKYSEIYQEVFEAQRDLVLCQWPDEKYLILEQTDHQFMLLTQEIDKVKKGTRFRVKKIIERDNIFVGNRIMILVEIEDPKFFAYKVNSENPIDAAHLTTKGSYDYEAEKTQFKPELLKKIENL